MGEIGIGTSDLSFTGPKIKKPKDNELVKLSSKQKLKNHDIIKEDTKAVK